MRTRPAARVVCLDAGNRVLLLRWRDPDDGSLLWEPPGGGIEPGETPLEAARRELREETGLDPGAVLPRGVTVPRDVRWNGVRYVGSEQFYLARFDGHRPEPHGGGLLADERQYLQAYAWIRVDELGDIDRLEPPALAAVIEALVPGQDRARRRQSGQ